MHAQPAHSCGQASNTCPTRSQRTTQSHSRTNRRARPIDCSPTTCSSSHKVGGKSSCRAVAAARVPPPRPCSVADASRVKASVGSEPNHTIRGGGRGEEGQPGGMRTRATAQTRMSQRRPCIQGARRGVADRRAPQGGGTRGGGRITAHPSSQHIIMKSTAKTCGKHSVAGWVQCMGRRHGGQRDIRARAHGVCSAKGICPLLTGGGRDVRCAPLQ